MHPPIPLDGLDGVLQEPRLHVGIKYEKTPTKSAHAGELGLAGESADTGFRVVQVPKLGRIVLLLSGAIAGFMWWRRRK